MGVVVGVEATPTHSTSPVNKGPPSVFHPYVVGVEQIFLKKKGVSVKIDGFEVSNK